jgi:hypothetical protein
MRDPELLETETQGVGVQAQDPSCAPRTLNDAVRFCKDAEDVGALHVLESLRWKKEVAGGQPLLEGLIDLNDGTMGENHGALDYILQFPHIAGPGIVHDTGHRIVGESCERLA